MTLSPKPPPWRAPLGRAAALLRLGHPGPPAPPGGLTTLRRHLARRERFMVLAADASVVSACRAPVPAGITLRSIVPADAGALAHLTPPRETLDRLHRGDLGTAAVRDADGRAVGCTWMATRAMDAEEHVVAVRPGPGEAYGYGLLVEPQARGRGVGRALVAAARARAVAMGATRILSHVVCDNEPQIALHRTIGSARVRTVTTVVVLDRFGLTLKSVAPPSATPGRPGCVP